MLWPALLAEPLEPCSSSGSSSGGSSAHAYCTNAAQYCGAIREFHIDHPTASQVATKKQITCPKAFLRPDSRLAAGRLAAAAALEGRAAARLQGLKAAALKAPAALLRLADTREEAAGAVSLQERFISLAERPVIARATGSPGAACALHTNPKERMRGARAGEWLVNAELETEDTSRAHSDANRLVVLASALTASSAHNTRWPAWWSGSLPWFRRCLTSSRRPPPAWRRNTVSCSPCEALRGRKPMPLCSRVRAAPCMPCGR